MRKLRRTVLVLLSCLSLTPLAQAQNTQDYNSTNAPNLRKGSFVGTGSFAGQTKMNGYSLDQFGDFVHDWHFVTVRHRLDTNEMRLTYANDLAWKALKEGKGVYPDGAAFAKVGIMAQEDPAFLSSVMPSGAKRFQLMVYDSKKHPETDGWGYALFDIDGKTFDIDPEGQTLACHACHRIVEDRGFVFSQIMDLDVHTPALKAVANGDMRARLEFATEDAANLSKKIQNALPPGTRQVRALQGELRGRIFQGTIDEIRPTLALEAVKSGMPAILYDGDGIRFSIAHIDPESPNCTTPNNTNGTRVRAPHTIAPPGDKTYPVSDNLTFCQGPVTY